MDIKKWQYIAEQNGCVFENIEFIKDGNGVKGVAIDKNKKVFLKVCKPVVINVKDIVIENDRHYIKSNINNELKNMLHEYLDFIFSNERIEELKKYLNFLMELPDDIKKILEKFYFEFDYKMDNKSIKEKLLGARTLKAAKYHEMWFMPFIDLLNHSFESGNVYDVKTECVVVEGDSSNDGEVFVRYNPGDVFNFLNKYFFLCKSPFAYSAVWAFTIENQNYLILRNILDFKFNNLMRIPKIEKNNNALQFNMIWLGSTFAPRQPFWSFKYLFEKELNRNDYLKIYSQIKGWNIKLLNKLIRKLDALSYENDITNMLKQAAYHQIDVIASSFEDL